MKHARGLGIIIALGGATGIAHAQVPRQATVPRPAPTVAPAPSRAALVRLSAVSPSAAYDGDVVTVTTSLANEHAGESAEITAGNIVKTAPLTFDARGGTARFTVPDVYAGLSADQAYALSQQPMTVRLTRGGLKTNALALRVQPLELKSESIAAAKPGDEIDLDGAFVTADVEAVLEYEPGKKTKVSVTPPNPPVHGKSVGIVHVPDVLTGKPLTEMTAILAYPGHIALETKNGAHESNKLPFHIMAPRPSAPSASSSSGDGPACAMHRTGYTYRGQPECQSTGSGPGSLKVLDAQCNYTCCASSPGASSGVCGANHYSYIPDCSQYCAGGGCNVQLMAGGCYQVGP